MKTLIVSFFHRKSIMCQENTINEGKKITRNKDILNNMNAGIWGFQHVTVEKAVAPYGWVIFARRFEETYRLKEKVTI
jgi:hypothetical protein